MNEVTRILNSCSPDDPKAAEELLPLVYDELRQLAAARMADEKPGQTIQATALVHEAWIRLLGPDHEPQSWNGRAHFFAAAAEAMRRILVDRARRKLRVKHGEGRRPLPLDTLPEPPIEDEDDDQDLLLVDEALERLAAYDSRKAEVVKLRYFAGLNHAEAAHVLNVSEKSVRRDWQFAKAWLCADIERQRKQEP